MRPVPKIAVDFIAAHEGCRLSAYRDSAGIPTIGYGHIDGVQMGDTCTKAQALDWLAEEVETKGARPLAAKIGGVVDDLTVNQYAALISFVFNLGTPGTTIWQRLKARQFDQVPQEMAKFVNAGGKKVQGLVNRRADEIKLWSTDEPGSTSQDLPSAVTRSIATPPTSADPIPAHQSATLITGALGVASTVPVAAKQVMDVVEPYKDASPWIGQVIAVVAGIAAAAAVLILALTWIKKHREQG